MKNISFTWDENKNKSNKIKHKVSFEEAKSVFLDENAFLFFDEDHSENEERYILLGMSSFLNVMIVCHCVIQNGQIIRIISARKATKNETRYYTGEQK
jgi:uncharacterized DUF497 family protein